MDEENFQQMSLEARTSLAAKLEKLKPKVREFSIPGDFNPKNSNYAAIDMQLRVLRGEVSREELDSMFGRKVISPHTYYQGCEAFYPIDDISADGLSDESLLDKWESLVHREKSWGISNNACTLI